MQYFDDGKILTLDPQFFDYADETLPVGDYGQYLVILPDITLTESGVYTYQAVPPFYVRFTEVRLVQFPSSTPAEYFLDRPRIFASFHTEIQDADARFAGVPVIVAKIPSTSPTDSLVLSTRLIAAIDLSPGSFPSFADGVPVTNKVYIGIGSSIQGILDDYWNTELPNDGISTHLDTGAPPLIDFNGDGRSDILWRHDDGRVAEWQMDGTTIVRNEVLRENPGTVWKIAEVGDFNGDGQSDILWRHDDGRVAEWQMDGTMTCSPETHT